jgi:excinuclease UvrABC helicase subunit UvrB/excinuclease UvrABC nuclease subunit
LDASWNWSVGDTFESVEQVVESLHVGLYSPVDEAESNDLARGQYQLSQGQNWATISLWPPSERFPMRFDLLHRDNNDDSDQYFISGIAHGHGTGMTPTTSTTIFPAKHHIKHSEEHFEETLQRIQEETRQRVDELRAEYKNQEADRLQQRVTQDLLLLRETGTCPGVENYSRHMALRDEGEPPDTLLDYLGLNQDWLLIVDESHVMLPQLKAMYGGDRARKLKLVKHGYRLPSALDNRPLRHEEFWERVPQTIFVSATPSNRELELSESGPVDMMIRPTFVCDPSIEVRPTQDQLDNLVQEIQTRAKRDERTLAIAITKRDAEDLADYLIQHGIASTYIHSGLNTHERSNALKALQNGEIDCLVGVNLLREGLDLPQVSLVAILNADAEGFLRSQTALLQTIGRAARNIDGMAILYANRITDSMQKCMDATSYRRTAQLAYNAENGKEMRSTKGSSVQSIFDLLKDQIQSEQPIEVVGSRRTSQKATSEEMIPVSIPLSTAENAEEIVTDHIPSKPGVYFWKDVDGNILYIGKAKKLRSRVKSYLSPNAKHTSRIKVMLKKAKSVEFVLTPSDRDALILESNLIKHHQPLYNVLLKDDEAYPYICASIGDAYPQLSIVPRRQEGEIASRYKYFGPYPHFAEINTILQGIEGKYDLRATSFAARHGTFNKAEYHKLFQRVLDEVFESKGEFGDSSLPSLRSEYEEASLLFDSAYNHCRDVVAVGKVKTDDDDSWAIVHVLQLRDGLIAGRFSYTCELGSGLATEEDYAAAIQTVLERQHYPSGAASSKGRFSFFPDEVLLEYPLTQQGTTDLKGAIRSARQLAEPDRRATIALRTAAKRGQRKETDARAMTLALENAQQAANERSWANTKGVIKTSVDGTAMKELVSLLSLKEEPRRIECYDVSHTQGDVAVASRVVFIDGKPAKHLYRRFNIKTVDGVDDYASLEEVLERRFQRAWVNGEGGLVDGEDPWSMPDLVVIDGGKGQLSAALKGMARASVYPLMELEVDAGGDTGEESLLIEENADDLVASPTSRTEDGGGGLPKRRTAVRVVALAKNQEEVFSPESTDPVNKSPDSAALLLLRAIRDESHRFALSAHRKRRSQMNGLK